MVQTHNPTRNGRAYGTGGKEEMAAAVRAVQAGTHSQAAAAREFGVKTSTLNDKIKKKYSKKPGTNRVGRLRMFYFILKKLRHKLK